MRKVYYLLDPVMSKIEKELKKKPNHVDSNQLSVNDVREAMTTLLYPTNTHVYKVVLFLLLDLIVVNSH